MQPSHLHYFPLPPIFYAIFAGILLALFVLIQIGVLRYAYARLGLGSRLAMVVLVASLLGSYINIPVAQLPEAHGVSNQLIDFFGVRYKLPVVIDWPGTVIAPNLGGAVIPTLLSVYLLAKNRLCSLDSIGRSCERKWAVRMLS